MRWSRSDPVVFLRLANLEAQDRQRLWGLLLRTAEERGADAFSIHPDTSLASSPPTFDVVESLMSYLKAIPSKWHWSLRPPARSLDEVSRRWLHSHGSDVFQVTLWAGKRWLLRSELWGRTVTLMLRQDEWEVLRATIEATLGPLPFHSIRKWRELGPSEAGGWGLPGRRRWSLIVGGAIVAGVGVGFTSGWLEGSWASLGAVLFLLAGLPQHDPSLQERLMVRTGSLTDAVFERRLRLALNLGSTGAAIAFISSAAVGVAEPSWRWKPLFWALLGLGVLMMGLGAAPAASWLWRRRKA